MSNPIAEIRKRLESESHKIANLINKNIQSDNVKQISKYIDDLQTLLELTEVKASTPTYKNDYKHEHFNYGAKVETEKYDYQPYYDTSNKLIQKSEVIIQRDTIFYRISTRYRINANQIGIIDNENKRVLVSSIWLELTENELLRLNELINSDY